jgi:hypothetical protein
LLGRQLIEEAAQGACFSLFANVNDVAGFVVEHHGQVANVALSPNHRRTMVKTVAFNGSPNKNGNTWHAIKMVADELQKEGIAA